MSLDVRTLTEAEILAYQTQLEGAFGADPDEEELAAWRPLVEPDRTHVAFDGSLMVGTAAVFTFDMTVPGGPLPCAGVTGVSVLSTHRRQGALTRLMREQLDAVRERGTEPFAALWASEALIYGRFGYGVASRRWSVTVAASEPSLHGRPPAGQCRLVDLDTLRGVAPALYDAVRAERPGMISRSENRWEARLSDLPANRGGASKQRVVTYEADGDVHGYALYRMKGDWSDGRPQGTVRVKELVALDPDAHGGLWRYLLGVDLTTNVAYDNVPGDDAVFTRLRDPRVAQVHVTDGLYVRLLDVPAALTRRAYAAPGRVTVEVVDTAGYAGGCFALDASPDGATCAPVAGGADVTLSAADLGAVYLGDTTLLSLWEAGRVDEHAAGAVRAVSRLLAWDRAAWCPEIF